MPATLRSGVASSTAFRSRSTNTSATSSSCTTTPTIESATRSGMLAGTCRYPIPCGTRWSCSARPREFSVPRKTCFSSRAGCRCCGGRVCDHARRIPSSRPSRRTTGPAIYVTCAGCTPRRPRSSRATRSSSRATARRRRWLLPAEGCPRSAKASLAAETGLDEYRRRACRHGERAGRALELRSAHHRIVRYGLHRVQLQRLTLEREVGEGLCLRRRVDEHHRLGHREAELFRVHYAFNNQPRSLVRTDVVEAHGLLDFIRGAQPEQSAGLANDQHLQHVPERALDVPGVGHEVGIGERWSDDRPV